MDRKGWGGVVFPFALVCMHVSMSFVNTRKITRPALTLLGEPISHGQEGDGGGANAGRIWW